MALNREEKIDHDKYPFKRFVDEQRHLDTDELRHMIKPIVHIIDQDFKGKEHLYCDSSQLDAQGKFRRPKAMIEAESRGFKTVMEMMEFDKSEAEKAKGKELEDLRATVKKQEQLLEYLMSKIK